LSIDLSVRVTIEWALAISRRVIQCTARRHELRPTTLRYGKGEATLPDRILKNATFIGPKPAPPAADADRLLRGRLAEPVGAPPLRSLLKAADSVAVPISDITRYSATELFLSPLLAETDAAGVPRSRVTLFVARGTHRAQTEDEIAAIVGPELSSGIRVVQSDPDGDMATLGVTSRGTKVQVFKPVMEHDRIVLTGTISFHYFAGFGGGRKALVPGCAHRDTAAATHFRVFPPDGPGKHPMARAGQLDGNPVHEDIEEAVAMATPTFLLNTLLTPAKKLFDAVAGDWRLAHREACERYAAVFRVSLPHRYPLVIASAGGWPKDINVIQSHKALDNAFRAVTPGGVLILLAECADGFGSPNFFHWFRFEDPDQLEVALRADYQIYGQTAHATLAKAHGCRVILVSSIRGEEVERMGMTAAASLADALEKAAAALGGLPPALVMPDAGYLLPDAG
jgi:nickel-dependent lactate racemase